MKILYLLPYNLVPPNVGNKILIFNLLKYIVQSNDCDIVIMLNEQEDSDSARKEIRSEIPGIREIKSFNKPRGIHKLLYKILFIMQGLHPVLSSCSNSSLKNWIKAVEKEGKYELIHFDMFYMAIYRKYFKNTKTILVPSDSYSLAKKTALHRTQYLHKKALHYFASVFLSRIEKKYYRKMDIVVTVSPIDAKYLRNMQGITNVEYAGIALSESLINLIPQHIVDLESQQQKGILCTGGVSNEHVAKDLLLFLDALQSHLSDNVKHFNTTILGKSPVSELRNYVSKRKNIVHIEHVDNYYEYLDADWVYIYAQKCGTGLQTKVQQALACGLPVVGFPVAFSGMPELVHGRHCYICHSYDELVIYSLSLLTDKSKRLEMGMAAREIICANYSSEKIGNKYIEYYRSLLADDVSAKIC